MSFQEDETVDEVDLQLDDPVETEVFSEPGIEIGATSHRGAVREANEDQYCVVRRTRSGEVVLTSLAKEQMPRTEDRAWLLTVADGLGGHVSGEVASATVIRTILDFANRLGSWIMRPAQGLEEDLAERAELFSAAIQREMQQQASCDPRLSGMATTVTSAYVFGSNATVLNVGDSRSYLIRDGEIHQITQDHTLGRELQEKGLSEEYAHPYRNLLTRCFDTSAKPVTFDLFHLSLHAEDRILLCSDGLSDMISDDAMLMILDRAPDTKSACDRLVAAALHAGGRDNITVVLARILAND